ncbi:protein G12-like [Schistocerca americana]|uniref:protein G12-like n=1 Tax=Schistocerca americana TaxID=7009 RepID=UPI001F4F3109|nr:protein G12-like [Schistocerca americana]
MSDEFESIVVYVDQQPELCDLLNFLESSGLDPYGFLNTIHDFLGIPQITKPASRMRRSSRSLKSMLDEILAILPVDELKALYHEKLETSADFAELINRLSSDEFHQLVLRVVELDAVQDLIQMLSDAGIDVDSIMDFFRKIFGWTF